MTDSLEDRLTALIRQTQKEAAMLSDTLDRVIAVRWDRSPATMGPSDRLGVSTHDGPADPTADTATDPNRLYLTTVIQRAEKPLRAALVGIRGVRRGLELALDYWAGPEDDEEGVA